MHYGQLPACINMERTPPNNWATVGNGGLQREKRGKGEVGERRGKGEVGERRGKGEVGERRGKGKVGERRGRER